MDDTKQKELTPEEVMMNALVEAERIQDVVIIIRDKSGDIEWWSNHLSIAVRMGMIEFVRANLQHMAVHGYTRET